MKIYKSVSELTGRTPLMELRNIEDENKLCARLLAKLAGSRNEARRAVEQGGVSVNGEKITDIHTSYETADFSKDFVLKKGKKKFCKVVM